jgi:hypothetical protein
VYVSEDMYMIIIETLQYMSSDPDDLCASDLLV